MNTPVTGDAAQRQKGFLGFVERAGNLLPDPVMIFVWLILALMILSTLGAYLGWSASIPYTGEEAPHWATLENGILTYTAESLFTEENISRLLVEMPKTLTGFAPLGTVAVIMYGAAVAERSGLFSALIRSSLRNAPRALLTPCVIVIGMVSHHASDAAYVVFIPLAAIIYASSGDIRWSGRRRPSRRCPAVMPAISRQGRSTSCCSASPKRPRGLSSPAG